MRLRPTKTFFYTTLAWLVLGVAASLWSPLQSWWWGFGAVAAVVILVDGLVVLAARRLDVQRVVPGKFALDVPEDVRLKVENRSGRGLSVRVYDGIPLASEAEDLPWQGAVGGKSFIELRYPVVMKKRGELVFSQCEVLERSLVGLWERKHLFGQAQSTKVYPNYQPVIRFALLAIAHRQNSMGIIRRNRAGMSRDFHQLRDYQMGDALSQIDWKSSSKRLSLIARDYQEQRDQTVIFMLDCGRRMRAMDGELSQFDHMLNAVLFLSYLALRQGDQVGLVSFGGTERYLPPVKGIHAMSTILNHLYDYETAPFPSDFSEAAERLLLRQRKRAMVVMLTNLRGEDGDELVEPLRRLRQKHLVVMASLREQGIDGILEQDIYQVDDALSYLAIEDYKRERKKVMLELSSHGVRCLDETAEKFPVALANCYLASRDAL